MPESERLKLSLSETVSDSERVKFSLRVMINKEKDKAVFAEVDNDFADVLLSFLTLPLGTIVRLMGKHFGDEAPTIGSLNTLYQGLENLDSCHFWTDACKHMLLNARNPLAVQCKKLKINIDDSGPTKYYFCLNCNYAIYGRQHRELQCNCTEPLIREIILGSTRTQTACGDVGGFTQETATFLISDDLQVLPNSAGSAVQLLKSLGIEDTGELEERMVGVGFKEVMDLFKASILSRTPLTDLILQERPMLSSAVIPQIPASVLQIEEGVNSKKIIIKVIIRKSTNKVLLAQAYADFIDFLFSLLAIPLGRVEHLLGGHTNLGSVDNLYRSITSLDCERFLKTENLKSILLKPGLPPEYLCENHIFSLCEDFTYVLTCKENVHFVDLNGKLSYVKGTAMFMVTDDLVVAPLSGISSLSIINRDKAPLSDIEELPFEIGMQEALNIVKASLNSTSALTDGLKPFLRRQEKQEN